jgi:hypothetical protein
VVVAEVLDDATAADADLIELLSWNEREQRIAATDEPR